ACSPNSDIPRAARTTGGFAKAFCTVRSASVSVVTEFAASLPWSEASAWSAGASKSRGRAIIISEGRRGLDGLFVEDLFPRGSAGQFGQRSAICLPHPRPFLSQPPVRRQCPNPEFAELFRITF